MLRRPSRRALARGALAGVMVLPAVAVVATGAGARSTDGLYLERKWDAVPDAVNAQNARLLIDGRHRRAFSFFTTTAGLNVRTYDLGKRTLLGTLPVEAGVTTVRSQTPIVLDEARGLAVLAPEPVRATQDATKTGDIPGVRVYAAHGRTLTKAGQPATRFPAGYVVLGLAVDAPRNRLLAIAAPNGGGAVQTVGAGVGGIMLDSWRLDDLAQGRVASEFTQPLRVPATCGQLMSTLFPTDIMPSADGKSVYFGCLSNRGPVTLLGPNAGDVGGVARLDLTAAETSAPSALRIRPISGNYAKGDTFAIPHQGRFVLLANDAVNTTIKVFDTTHGFYVGNVGLDKEVAAIGFDPASGRGYYVNDAGFGVFEAATTPVTQGVVYADLAPLFGLAKRTIEVDPKTHRVYVPTADDVIGASDPWIAILKDGTSFATEEDGDIDADALDVAEVPGKYDSRRTVDAGAMGAEYRMVGGPTNLIFNAAHVDTRGILTRAGTRSLQMAATRSVRMTPDEASVHVVTMRTDDATAADLDGTHLAEPVLCNDFGAGVDKKERPDATVICDTSKQKAEGIVSAEPGRVLITHSGEDDPVPANVVVKQAKSSVDTFRDDDGMLVSKLHAEATGIDLMGVVQIGRVAADATVKLRGRTGSAVTTYQRSVQGLVVNGTPVCDNCPLDAVGAAIEEVFGGRVLVTFPEPYEYASPRGTRAGIADNPYRHVERSMFDDVPEDTVVTPAMEVVVYLDGTAPSRLIAGFASISAQGRYKIFKVGSDDFAPPPPAVPPLDPVVPDTVVGSDGGTVTTPAGPAPAGPTVAAPVVPNNVVAKLVEGMKIVFRSPRHLASVAALWSLLALPTYLAARRRLLLDLPFLRRTVEES